jgi:hypothetical protein
MCLVPVSLAISVSTKQTLARRWFDLVGSNRFGITLAAHRLGILPWSTRTSNNTIQREDISRCPEVKWKVDLAVYTVEETDDHCLKGMEFFYDHIANSAPLQQLQAACLQLIKAPICHAASIISRKYLLSTFLNAILSWTTHFINAGLKRSGSREAMRWLIRF